MNAALADRAKPPAWRLDGGRLADGRLHLHQGPIDLVIEAAGPSGEVEQAYEQAARRFEDVLAVLVSELPALRLPVTATARAFAGPVARRMQAACWPHRETFITPMAAVAGAVSDEILEAMTKSRRLRRAYVNNGGDIALHLEGDASFRIGVAGIEDARVHGDVSIVAADPWRGVATSGWRGRSQSLGIADSVTVIAHTAAAADAAATLVANAVDVDHPSVHRRPAHEVRDDSDLGTLPVTVRVDRLPADAVNRALDSGAACARRMLDAGLIGAAYLRLQGMARVCE
ncbi:MAG: UPF0280 family protein [Betaproteobacteria bacterium]|nr:UPF0280 family protein [Betaproteobacteria bacterium]